MLPIPTVSGRMPTPSTQFMGSCRHQLLSLLPCCTRVTACECVRATGACRGSKPRYLYSDEELAEATQGLAQGSYSVQRFKVGT